MFDFGTDWWEIILRTTIVYFAIVFGFRLTGKRQIGQLAPFDLVVILLIANAVQNAMVGPDVSLGGGLISAATLLVVNRGVAEAGDRWKWMQRLVEGEPVVLVRDGVIDWRALRKERIEQGELDQAMREHGINRIEDVKEAVLEIDGTVSVVPQEQLP